MSEEENWKKAHNAYLELLTADIEAEKAELRLLNALQKIFPNTTLIIKRADTVKKILEGKPGKETKKLLRISIEDFKKMVDASLKGDKTT